MRSCKTRPVRPSRWCRPRLPRGARSRSRALFWRTSAPVFTGRQHGGHSSCCWSPAGRCPAASRSDAHPARTPRMVATGEDPVGPEHGGHVHPTPSIGSPGRYSVFPRVHRHPAYWHRPAASIRCGKVDGPRPAVRPGVLFPGNNECYNFVLKPRFLYFAVMGRAPDLPAGSPTRIHRITLSSQKTTAGHAAGQVGTWGGRRSTGATPSVTDQPVRRQRPQCGREGSANRPSRRAAACPSAEADAVWMTSGYGIPMPTSSDADQLITQGCAASTPRGDREILGVRPARELWIFKFAR